MSLEQVLIDELQVWTDNQDGCEDILESRLDAAWEHDYIEPVILASSNRGEGQHD